MQWTPEAEACLKEVPFFVRPAVRRKLEKYAELKGVSEITPELYAEAKAQFGNS